MVLDARDVPLRQALANNKSMQFQVWASSKTGERVVQILNGFAHGQRDRSGTRSLTHGVVGFLNFKIG